MQIQILYDNGYSIPMLLCDLCNKPIEKGQQAEYPIPDLNEGDTGEAIVGHAGCTYRYEKISGASYGNMSLGFLFWALIANTGTDYDHEKKMAETFRRLA
jgi:hypothetical protein